MNFKSLRDCLHSNKINKFDFIIIFSDFFKIMLKNKKISDEFCDELKDNVKYFMKFKTILLPTFNLDFYKTLRTGNDVKYVTTGYLNKFLLQNVNFFRTKNPIGNFSVVGKEVKKILDLKQQSLFGSDSVISYLSKNKTLGFGVGIDPDNFGWTTNHVCEEEMNVPYRFFKNFSGLNCDTNQKVEEKVFVRKLNMRLVGDETVITKELLKKKKSKKLIIKV